MIVAAPASFTAAVEQIALNAICEPAAASAASAEMTESAAAASEGALDVAAASGAWKVAAASLAGAVAAGILLWFGLGGSDPSATRNEANQAVGADSSIAITLDVGASLTPSSTLPKDEIVSIGDFPQPGGPVCR